MTCIVCGTDTNPYDLCHTCQRWFLWRYQNDGEVLHLVLKWFRTQHGGELDEFNEFDEINEVDSIGLAALDDPADFFDGSGSAVG